MNISILDENNFFSNLHPHYADQTPSPCLQGQIIEINQDGLVFNLNLYVPGYLFIIHIGCYNLLTWRHDQVTTEDDFRSVHNLNYLINKKFNII